MNPYVLLGIVLLWVVSLFGVGKWQRHDGASEAKLECTTTRNVELVEANAKIKTMNDAARAAERKNATDIADLGDKHAVEKLGLEDQRRRDVAAARAGALKLRYNAPAGKACGGGVPDAGASPAGGEPATETVELPREVGSDLYALADDANLQASELNTCWAIVRADRAMR